MTRSVWLAALVSAGLAGCAASAAPSGVGLKEIAKPQSLATDARGDGIVGYAHAESRYGHGSISGPVRRGGGSGLEVMMPRGTWLDCGRSCSDTLRRQTVDFWENHGGPNSPGDGRGYLTWRW
jgi:hypothetical protein